ncbi:hypothetical protein [Brevundimonas sp.]|jgi:hypothetical protein|nr:hypothetical protein [Brevundimonas sp.]
MFHTGPDIRHKHPGSRRAAVAIPVVVALSVLAWWALAVILG